MRQIFGRRSWVLCILSHIYSLGGLVKEVWWSSKEMWWSSKEVWWSSKEVWWSSKEVWWSS